MKLRPFLQDGLFSVIVAWNSQWERESVESELGVAQGNFLLRSIAIDSLTTLQCRMKTPQKKVASREENRTEDARQVSLRIKN